MNKKTFKYFWLMIALLAGSVIFFGCSSSAQINSGWNNIGVKVDGDPAEWNTSGYIVKDEKVSLNFRNDDKFLYICLMTSDRSKVMQMTRSGFVVWFYPENNDEKIFGIKFPMQVSLLDKNEKQEFNKDLFRPDEMQTQFNKMILDANEFQVINEDKYPLNQYSIENNEGIKAKLGINSDRFIYELQVPIESQENYTYKVAVKPGDKVKVEFETLESENDEMPGSGMGKGMPPGGGGPGDTDDSGGNDSQGPQRGGGMRKGESGFSKPEPFNFTVELQLKKQN